MKLIIIIGTALSICLITIILANRQIRMSDTSTERYRSRTLYVPFMNVKEKDGASNGSVATIAIREIFLKMKTPEAVAAYTLVEDIAMEGKQTGTFDVKVCNDGFFKLYKLHFIAGKPCSEDQDKKEVLLSETTCRKLLGTFNNAIGRTITINRIPYKVCGIVHDVTPTNKQAAADAWIGYDFREGSRILDIQDESGKLCNYFFKVDLLLRKNSDEAAVRKEMTQLTASLQKHFPDYTISFNGEPERRESFVYHYVSNSVPDMDKQHRIDLTIYLILLIVPAVNLMNIALSSFSRQENELRILRTFGATRNRILRKLVGQSMWQSL